MDVSGRISAGSRAQFVWEVSAVKRSALGMGCRVLFLLCHVVNPFISVLSNH